MKYKTESFISQETISEDLIYCCYNPKNTIELVLCGKGYLRLWNIFINEGALKEHQQRFISGKKEKDFPFPEFQKREVLFLFLVNRTSSVIHRMSSDHLAKLKRRECR